MTHPIRIGVGGWTYEPWRGVFYPEKLSQKKELAHMAGRLTSIEINGTYYSSFKPDTWMKWRDETPDDFVFAVKASRFCTNRKVLSEGGESFERFLSQGLTLLGHKVLVIEPRPEMLLAVRDTWPVLVISTLLVLVAGMLIAIFVVKFGNLDVTSAYLATSPGGLNVVVGLAADMGPNAPIVLAYQMVRLYTIILTVPLAARILHKFLS